jgi:integrin alpha FG-GAP repeat containing protein 1
VCDDGNSDHKHFQIWLNNKESGFALAEIGRFPAGAESITFADIGQHAWCRYRTGFTDYVCRPDRDGTMDLVFPTCDGVSATTGVGSNCFINIVFNQQLPICESATKPSVVSGRRVCRPVDDLCLRDSGFKIDFSTRSSNHVGRV